MESYEFQSAELRTYEGPVAGVKVLVVDANSACRAIVSKMLLSIGYEVMTATLASEALSIIRDKKNEVNLVLVEAQLPDMEIYDLTEKMREISDVPSFIITSYDDDIPSISRALSTGAKLCYRKPVKFSDLQGLWRFAVWNRYEPIFMEEVPGFWWYSSEVTMANNGLECRSSMHIGESSLHNANCKEQEFLDKDNSALSKRKRRTWTDDLHRKFLEAVEIAGINARPKKIFQLMDVEGLTKESVSNYLQKYRQSMKLRANAMEQHMNGYVSLTKNSRGKRPLFSEQQGVTDNPAISPKDLSNCMHVQVLDTSAYFSSLESSSSQEPPFGQNPPCLSLEKLGQELDLSTLLAFDTRENFFPSLPIALLPPLNEKDIEIYGGEGKIYEIFYAKGAQQFTDEDLNMWLSTIPDNLNNDANAEAVADA
ncbi:putative two-component response regulator-like APRR4 isoform X2 [Cicer arietinum]|uniref:Two-component response regulator ARR14 isoform X2 n=1 Tax=Cicer arietinum TaxID=3827 RepID=A0A1S2YW61_CICAR|nr:two-component response regulator ARR14 isoform X2 [Cicer arietinum]